MTSDILKRNNVKIKGLGTQPMLLAHGFGCDQNMWRHIAPAFEPDYRLILFDFVGSGQSDIAAYDSIRYNELNGYAQDVLDICQALELTKVVFVGHSVSSMIGLLAAIQQPQYFDRLIMIGPSPRYLNEIPDYVGGFERPDVDELLALMDQNFVRWANTLAPAIMGNADHPALGEELTQSFCSTDPLVMQQFARVTFLSDNRQDLPKLTVPTLILQSSDDIIAPQVVGEYTHQHLPFSSLQYMKASGHCPHMSAPEETIALMQAYLFDNKQA
ncbi:alpha/beta fold hydrolase [Spirosoma endbachense]|uniref:Alpha/beta fold hydrolase n=1 Tax=Spirosoma endbachense TaxID=2666025 RepID=A0A6P1VM58_9BACT|nr:alpha/beta hydrolase [Spirosoma endbachense]QHV93765.1 alpha/beta fold hydrolase [Spirosoma endbachense]